MHYIDRVAHELTMLHDDALYDIADALSLAKERGSWVYTIGNGGSAATASHFACDLFTAGMGKVLPLADLTPRMTALANDAAYEGVFSIPLGVMGQPGDVLVAISASGNSPNILAAIDTANEREMTTIALVAFDGGTAKDWADIAFHAQVDDYGIAEDIHSICTHAIARLIR